MKKYAVGTAVVAVFLCTVFVLILLPYMRAESTMPEEGVLTVRQLENGQMQLSWTAAEQADSYLVQILLPGASDGQEPEEIYTATAESHTGILLPELPMDRELTLRVRSAVNFFWLGRKAVRYGKAPLEATARLNPPTITELNWTAEPETDTVSVSFQMRDADYCRVCRGNAAENGSQLRIMTDNRGAFCFGESAELPMPAPGESSCLTFAASREMPGLILHGMATAQIRVERQDLLGRELNVCFSMEENNGIVLTWDETKGEYYEIQRMDGAGEWETVCRVEQTSERYYSSGPLEKFREFRYRVIAAGGQTMEGSDYAAESEVFCFTTRESPLYATVWPVKDMDAYFDGKRTVVAASVECGKAYCVTDERNGSFGVRIGDQICYIDSNYCMINLPDYIGDLCSYQISNSTGSAYTVHEFGIDNVTAVVTPGYENVYQADGGYLVPLLYPTAKKLISAAQDAISRGYRLKIYDSFRPQIATRDIYDRTSAVLNTQIPSKTFTGKAVSALELPEPEEGAPLTYRRVMTNDIHALNSFLAKGTSRHNLGVALDLTLEDPDTGAELDMQTSMHDLSWYSTTQRNNANARILGSIMTKAGFAPLSSEWWHFQDDDSKNQLQLTAVWDGISAEGWTCDGTGWRYRDGQGICYTEQTLTVGDCEYTFDTEGYLMDGEIAFG